jgi:xylulokinase
MPSPAVLTIDVGNSYLKVTLFDTACRHIDHVSAPTPCGEENLAETAEKWWGVTCHCSRVLTGRNPQYQTAVIGATGYMHALVAVDCHGTPIAFPSRPKGGRANLDQMIDSFDVRRIYGITGSRLDVTSVPPTILTWREWSPQLFSKVSMLLPVKEFIRFRLTDQFATDHIDACGTMLYDLRHRRWSRDLLSC